ncbi:MAG: hypothetical protein H6741_18485 [Alphaproteobacteria bacterium]|nr:hypothetical protein [Alphaproteobacteria bacterium]MCB9794704.1 hypothetical protein [Alphaproteobacteria bacterium]
MTSLLLLSAALAQAPLGLSPTPQELQAGLADLERHLTRADAVGEALSATQNAYAQRRAAGAPGGCADVEGLGIAARTEVFGAAYRDLLQSARAQSQRVHTMAEAPTVSALAEGVLAEEIATLERRLDGHERRLAESIAWQRSQLSSTLQRCEHPLIGGEGFAGDRELRLDRGRVAVIVLEGGVAWPQGEEITGGVWLVPPEACWAPAEGECAPAPTAPGAALGPAPERPPELELPPTPALPPELEPEIDLEAPPPRLDPEAPPP